MESLYHIASISPVIINESRRFVVAFTPKNDTVVSSVFGKSYSNINASTGSASTYLTSAMTYSIIVELNLRSAGAGRLGSGNSLLTARAVDNMAIITSQLNRILTSCYFVVRLIIFVEKLISFTRTILIFSD